jgi:hypothetical protein
VGSCPAVNAETVPMACTTAQMLQDAILGWARPRPMSRMYGSAAAAVSALPTTVTAIVTVLVFTAPPR